MTGYFNNLSIKYKLLTYFIAIILITVLIIGILTNIVFSNSIESAASQSTIQAIDQTNKSIETYLMNMENVINIISRHPQIIEFFRDRPIGDNQQLKFSESELRSFLAGITENYDTIEGMALISANSQFLSNEMYQYIQDPLEQENWYKETVLDNGRLHILASTTGRKITEYKKISADELISITKAIKDPASNQITGIILIDLNMSILENILHSANLSKNGFIYIVNATGEYIYSPLNYVVPRVRNTWFAKEQSGVFVKSILKEQFQFIYTTSAYTGWKTVGVFSLNETLKEVNNIRYYSMLIFLVVVLLAVGASFVFSSSIAKPINKLRALMKKAEEGDLKVVFDVKYNDEIGQLGNSFNTMIMEIKSLVETVYEEQKNKREAELRALQSQIKPHFLYNTLDTIHWMAKKYNAKDVIEVINALTNLFRIGLSRGKEIIRVADEIEHVKSYLFIQKVRYEDMLDYTITMDKEVEGLFVQKLILQPIIENAIYHGIKEKREPGFIDIKARIVDQMLVFTIVDNGVGISCDRLNNIKGLLEKWKKSGDYSQGSNDGYGLFNINERIKLSYGNSFGVSISSEAGTGTVVEIKHPVILG